MEQIDLLRHVIRALEETGVPYMLVGSLASGAYGEPRLTQDIDVVIDLHPSQVDALCEAFPESDFYVSRDAARQAVTRGGQFNVIHPGSGNKIDFMIARKDAWGQAQMSGRQRTLILPRTEGYTARPEVIILSKMQYYLEGGSEKHLRDITGIMKVSGDEVDRAYVELWARRLGVQDIWRAILGRLECRG